MMNYFKPEEFKCKCGKCDGGSMDAAFVEKLNQARHLAQIPFVITSAFRCEQHNKNVGGKPNSAHLRGKAVDLKFKDSQSAFKILQALISVGFNRVGYNQKNSFFHVDNDSTLPQNVFFDY